MTSTRAYFDHNATTPLRAEVLEGLQAALAETYGNASSIHRDGQQARQLVEEARRKVALFLGADPREIVFTSGGTESDNTAIFGVVSASGREPKHVVTTAIEHPAVLNACERLEQSGVAVSYVPVGASGVVNPEDIEAALRPRTVLVSVMHANNEIGTVQPVTEIAEICHRAGVPLHVDAVQSCGKLSVDCGVLGVNLLSMSAHKLYGPKGVGVLWIRKGTPFTKLLYGGHHERDRRPGTENVPGIHALGIAASLSRQERETEARRQLELRDHLEALLVQRIDGVSINAAGSTRLPNTSNVRVEGVDGEPLVIALDLRGFAVSSGAACSSGSVEPSHVLTAIGLSREDARSCIRISLGASNTREQVEALAGAMEEAVHHLRRLAPAKGAPISSGGGAR
ncbi:MAG: cysteine desulfurase [Bryobacterales bacterium]|nr:cysteine desulfurase [Bryobacterales bacterium]